MVINPEIGSAAISGGAGLVGSVLGYVGQRKANKTNLKIARETNAMNYKIASETNAMQQANFERQLAYNSPIEQRRMLEAAGYNPAVLYGSGGNAVVSAPNAPSMHAAQMQRAEVQPYLGFSQDLSVMGQNLAAIAEARKADSERKGQEIDNAAKEEQYRLLFAKYGLENKWQEIQNNIADKTFDEQVARIINESDKSLEEKNKMHMENALLEKFGEREAQRKIEHLEAQINLWKQQGKTEITQQELNRALRVKSLSDAAFNKVHSWALQQLTPAQVGYYTAAGNNQGWLGRVNQLNSEIIAKFGEGQAAVNILKTLAEKDFSEAATEEAWKQVQKLNKDIQWSDFEHITNAAKIITQGLGAAGWLLLGL